jgi:hypothetical protein
MATQLRGSLEISRVLSVRSSDGFLFVPKSPAHISAPATISAINQIPNKSPVAVAKEIAFALPKNESVLALGNLMSQTKHLVWTLGLRPSDLGQPRFRR